MRRELFDSCIRCIDLEFSGDPAGAFQVDIGHGH